MPLPANGKRGGVAAEEDAADASKSNIGVAPTYESVSLTKRGASETRLPDLTVACHDRL